MATITSAEQLFISKVLKTKDYSLILQNNITENHFFDLKPEFNFIKNHYAKYDMVPDVETFCSTFDSFDYIDTNEPTNFILDKFFKEYKENFLGYQFNLIKAQLESGNLDKALKIFSDAQESMSKNSIALEGVDIFQDTSRFNRYEDKINGKDEFYISTGFKELDQLIGGIDRENENMVIAARTGIGKTMILTKIAEYAASLNIRVGFYEGEMSVDKLAHRVDTMKSHISNVAINRGDPFIHNQYKEYINSLPSLDQHFIILTPDNIGGEPTVDVLAAFVEKYKLDILFVDQYSLLVDTSRATKENERIANISKAIKMLQVKKKIPIISVSQNNRTKNEEGTHDTTQIYGSDRIGQDATVILMLDKKDDQLDIDVVKARDGGDGHKLSYNINFNTGQFTYIPQEGDGISTEADFEDISASYEIENPF